MSGIGAHARALQADSPSEKHRRIFADIAGRIG